MPEEKSSGSNTAIVAIVVLIVILLLFWFFVVPKTENTRIIEQEKVERVTQPVEDGVDSFETMDFDFTVPGNGSKTNGSGSKNQKSGNGNR